MVRLNTTKGLEQISRTRATFEILKMLSQASKRMSTNKKVRFSLVDFCDSIEKWSAHEEPHEDKGMKKSSLLNTSSYTPLKWSDLAKDTACSMDGAMLEYLDHTFSPELDFELTSSLFGTSESLFTYVLELEIQHISVQQKIQLCFNAEGKLFKTLQDSLKP